MEKKKADKSTVITIVLVAILLIGVVIYGVADKANNKENGKETKAEPTVTSVAVVATPSTSVASAPQVSDESTIASQTESKAESKVESTASKPESKETVSKATSKATSKPKKKAYTLPTDLTKWFSKSLVDIYGYIPTEDLYYNGGQVFSPEECPYALCYSPGEYDAPVAILGALSTLLDGKNSYSYTELKEIFGSKLDPLMENEAFGGYIATASIDGYYLYMESDSSTFESFTIYQE